ncbi:MAG: hypothetical protein Q4B68_09895, partial [Bacteroidales bacterium]|nr:hypothetical protein [Bacteroidales bacterium]
ETREVVEIVDGNQYISEQRFKINEYHCCLQPVNQFGEVFVGEDAPSIELDFVPVRIDELDEDRGNCMFLSFSSYAEPNPDGTRVDDDDVAESEEGELIQPYIVQELENGEQEKSTEYYSKIFVAFWDGALEAGGMNPHPYTDSVIVRHDGTIFRPHYSLRINRPNGMMRFSTHRIDTRQTYTFSFLADSIPDVRAVFHINGKRYLAEKITATFTAEAGMSQLLKGTFRKIIE